MVAMMRGRDNSGARPGESMDTSLSRVARSRDSKSAKWNFANIAKR